MELECSICMDSKELEKINFLPCIHFLCLECYEKLKKNECPFCRNKIKEEDSDSYDERENEYNDVEFEMLVSEESTRPKRKNRKDKKQEKRIMKLLKNNQEIVVSINSRNTYSILTSQDLME